MGKSSEFTCWPNRGGATRTAGSNGAPSATGRVVVASGVAQMQRMRGRDLDGLGRCNHARRNAEPHGAGIANHAVIIRTWHNAQSHCHPCVHGDRYNAKISGLNGLAERSAHVSGRVKVCGERVSAAQRIVVDAFENRVSHDPFFRVRVALRLNRSNVYQPPEVSVQPGIWVPLVVDPASGPIQLERRLVGVDCTRMQYRTGAAQAWKDERKSEPRYCCGSECEYNCAERRTWRWARLGKRGRGREAGGHARRRRAGEAVRREA